MWDSRDLVRGRITLYEATKVKLKKKKIDSLMKPQLCLTQYTMIKQKILGIEGTMWISLVIKKVVSHVTK